MLRKVTRNFQITLPKSLREELDIQEGDYVEIEREDGGILVRKVDEERETVQLEEDLTPDEIEEGIDRGMDRCRST